VVLARLLTPEDYGLVSMVTSLIAWVLMLAYAGTDEAVVQRPQISEGEVSALFWITVALGLASGTIVAACGPLIAEFYGEPRLLNITIVAGLTFVTSGMFCQHRALMRRSMRFDEISAVEIAANLLSTVVAVVMALQGFAYWALVLKPVLMNAFLAAGLWLRSGWIPGKPTMTRAVKEMLWFGVNTTGFTASDVGSRSMDKAAIGYGSGAAALGRYQNAMLIYENVLSVLTSALHPVAVASLSKVSNDPKEFKRLWGKALSTLSFWSMPAFGLLAVTSQDLILVLLGKKWASTGILLTILALRGIPHTIERTLGWLHVPAGRSDRLMRWGLFALCAQGLALVAGLPWGAVGVTVAYVISMYVLFVPSIVYAGKPLGIGARDLIAIIWRPFLGSLVAAAAGFAVDYALPEDWFVLLRIAAVTLAYLAVYAALVVGILSERASLGVTLSATRSFVPARLVPSVD
jgi:PST family polysaccharide transporter